MTPTQFSREETFLHTFERHSSTFERINRDGNEILWSCENGVENASARWTSHAYRAFLSRRGAGIATLLYFISNCKKETREWRQKWLTLLASVASFRIPAKVIPAPIVLHLRMLLHLYELLVSRFIHRSRKICWRSSIYPFSRFTFV